MIEEKRPKVRLSVIVIKNGAVLLGKRKSSHDAETWNFPGGHLEYLETFTDCTLRETKEETGLEIELIDELPVAVTNDFFEDDEKHYITLFLRARYLKGEPKVMEPDKCDKWGWFYWRVMPSNLMLPIKNLIKQKYNPFKN